MKQSRHTDWIVSWDGSHSEYPYGFQCLRCGALHGVHLPIPLDDYITMSKAFIALHAFCLPPEDEERTE
jgi:hypothetical protein